MKKISRVIFVLGLFWIAPVFADQQSDAKNAAMEQAKRDYAVYLQELKALSGQYKQITSAMKEVIQEQGVPSWNETTGEIEVDGVKRTAIGHSFVDVDIQDGDKDMTVKVDMPGVKKDKIQVSLKDDTTLRVSGQSDSAKRQGPFEQFIELPAKAKAKGIEASYENGVLTVKIPKNLEANKEVPIPVR